VIRDVGRLAGPRRAGLPSTPSACCSPATPPLRSPPWRRRPRDQPDAASRCGRRRGRIGRPARRALYDGDERHALDYDDVDDALIAHPQCSAGPHPPGGGRCLRRLRRGAAGGLPARLGDCRVVAGVLGVESHYQAGWHSTSTHRHRSVPRRPPPGSFGCRPPRFSTASDGGHHGRRSRQNFGTMTKTAPRRARRRARILGRPARRAGFTPIRTSWRAMGLPRLYGDASTAGPRPPPMAEEDEPAGPQHQAPPVLLRHHAPSTPRSNSPPLCRAGRGSRRSSRRPAGRASPLSTRPHGLQAKFSLEYRWPPPSSTGGDAGFVRRPRPGPPHVQQLLRTVEVDAENAAGPPAGRTTPFRVVTPWRAAPPPRPGRQAARSCDAPRLREQHPGQVRRLQWFSVRPSVVTRQYEALALAPSASAGCPDRPRRTGGGRRRGRQPGLVTAAPLEGCSSWPWSRAIAAPFASRQLADPGR